MKKTYEVPEFDVTLLLATEDILFGSNDVNIETGGQGGDGNEFWGPQE